MNLRRRRIRDGCHDTLEGACCLSPTMENISWEEARDQRANPKSRELSLCWMEHPCVKMSHELKQRRTKWTQCSTFCWMALPAQVPTVLWKGWASYKTNLSSPSDTLKTGISIGGSSQKTLCLEQSRKPQVTFRPAGIARPWVSDVTQASNQWWKCKVPVQGQFESIIYYKWGYIP